MIPINTAPPSQRAQALSQSLSEAIRNFQHQHPGTDPEDVRQALMLVAAGTGGKAHRLAFALSLLIAARCRPWGTP